MCAAEDDLIDDYLSDRLASEDHERFERDYLASPRHRTRVAVARALRTAASTSGSTSSERFEHVVSWWGKLRAWPSLAQAALIAALVLLVAGGAWMLGTRSDRRQCPLERPRPRCRRRHRRSPSPPISASLPCPLSVTCRRLLAPHRWS